MKKTLKLLLLSIFLLLIFKPSLVLGENLCPKEACSQIKDLPEKIKCLEDVSQKCEKQRKDLASQIAYMDTQIRLATSRIKETENKIEELEVEIASLSARIERLEDSLTRVSGILLNRIVETYKRGDIEPWQLLFSSNGFSDFLTRAKYIRVIQMHDKRLMFQMQETKDNYSDQRMIREEKKKQQEKLKALLEKQKVDLARQIKDKEYLLEVTKNDEKQYQTLLAQARAELIAIRGILAGKGKEVKVGEVSQGQRIASLITGTSCNSSGTHLHFIVSENGNTHNPFSYLNNSISYENYSGSDRGSSDADPFNPSGGWNWPLNSPIKFSQGYGKTWAIVHTWVGQIYDFHNGIDITSDSLEVKAVQAGTLYQGVYQGSCSLGYVRVDHNDSNLDTLYLHAY